MKCLIRYIVSSLYTEIAIRQREQKYERAEVIALGHIGTHSTWHPPEVLSSMRKGFLIREVVCVALHRNAETLCQDFVSYSRVFLGSFHRRMISIIGNGVIKIGVGFKPLFGMSNLVNGVEFIPPDGYVGVVILLYYILGIEIIIL